MSAESGGFEPFSTPIYSGLSGVKSVPKPGLYSIWSVHAARLGRHRGGACVYRPAVPGGELRGPLPRPRPQRPRAAADLSAVAGDLLHVVDLLRVGRLGLAHRLRIPHHLHRPGADDRAVLAAPGAHRAAGQGAEHHLDRRLHRRALRQEPGGRSHRRADRDRRHDSLHRAAAQGGVVLARNYSRANHAGHRRHPSAARRYRAVRRAVDGDLRGAVRHAPYRRHRASGRLDAGDRHRIDRQAVRLPGGRHLCHLLDVRRPGRAARGGRQKPADGRIVPAATTVRHAARQHAAVVRRDHSAAAAVPRGGGRKQQRKRNQARGLAVSALSGGRSTCSWCRSRSPAC